MAGGAGEGAPPRASMPITPAPIKQTPSGASPQLVSHTTSATEEQLRCQRVHEGLVHCVLEEHGGPYTVALHQQSLGSAVDAPTLGAAWSTGLGDGFMARERAFGRLAAAFAANRFRDAWLLSTLTLLDRALTARGAASGPLTGPPLAVWLLTASLVALKLDNAEADQDCNIKELIVDRLGFQLLRVNRAVFRSQRKQLWEDIIKKEQVLLSRLDWGVAKCGPADLAVRLAVGAVYAAWGSGAVLATTSPQAEVQQSGHPPSPSEGDVVRQQDVVVDTAYFLVEMALTHTPQIAYGQHLPPALLALAAAGLAVVPRSPWVPAAALQFLESERARLQELMTPAQRAHLGDMTVSLLQLWQRPPMASHVIRKWRDQKKALPEPPAQFPLELADVLGVEPPPPRQCTLSTILCTPSPCGRARNRSRPWTPKNPVPASSEAAAAQATGTNGGTGGTDRSDNKADFLPKASSAPLKNALQPFRVPQQAEPPKRRISERLANKALRNVDEFSLRLRLAREAYDAISVEASASTEEPARKRSRSNKTCPRSDPFEAACLEPDHAEQDTHIDPSDFQEGDVVEICGCKKNQNLNGQKGSVHKFLEGKGRWKVKLANDESVHVLSENLRKLSASVASCVKTAMRPFRNQRSGVSRSPRPPRASSPRASQAGGQASQKASEEAMQQAKDEAERRYTEEAQTQHAKLTALQDQLESQRRGYAGLEATNSSLSSALARALAMQKNLEAEPARKRLKALVMSPTSSACKPSPALLRSACMPSPAV